MNAQLITRLAQKMAEVILTKAYKVNDLGLVVLNPIVKEGKVTFKLSPVGKGLLKAVCDVQGQTIVGLQQNAYKATAKESARLSTIMVGVLKPVEEGKKFPETDWIAMVKVGSKPFLFNQTPAPVEVQVPTLPPVKEKKAKVAATVQGTAKK